MGKNKEKKAKRRANGTRDAPDWSVLRTATHTRSDYTLSGSEAIYSAVSRIANTMAMLPIHLYKNHEIQREDWRERLINYQPNATMTPYLFQQTMEAFRNVEGNTYALMISDLTDPMRQRIACISPCGTAAR